MKVEAASLTLTGIRHAFFTRAGGVSGGFYESLNGGVGSHDRADKVAENRSRMAAALGVAPQRLLTAYQTHSPNVVVAEAPWTTEDRPRADAIVTRMRMLAIGVTTADCGPILLADPGTGAIGAMIRQSSYEVGPDLVARFGAEDPASDRFFAPATRNGHAMFDLAGYIAMRLKLGGVDQVEDLGLCTYADPARFFSYRRTTHRAETDYGRHVNAIALAGD